MAPPTGKRSQSRNRTSRNNRDDFSASIIRVMRERAGNVCSNFECRVSTLGPQQGGAGIVNHGSAAHVRAAAPNGKRYDESMTSTERSDISNGIWLCSNCASKIDRDEGYYTVERLHDWKRQAESAAAARLGSRIFANTEVVEEIQAGLSGFAKRPILEGIGRMHQAQAAALEALDPRFIVSTSYSKGITGFELNPRDQPVHLGISYAPEIADEFCQKMLALDAWGKQFEVAAPKLKITGSPLIEALESYQNGMIVVGPRSVAAVIKVRVSKGGALLATETLSGTATGGRLGASAVATAFNGLLSCSIELRLDPGVADQSMTTLVFDWSSWDGKDIRYLPHLADAIAFMKPIIDGGEISYEVSFEGHRILDAGVPAAPLANFFSGLLAFAQYTESCAVVASHLGLSIEFSTPSEPLHQKTVNEIHEAALIAKKRWVTTPTNVSFDLQVQQNESFVRQVLQDPELWFESLIVEAPRSVKMFGREVTLPGRVLIFEKVRITSDCLPEDVVAGKDIKVALNCEPGAQMRVEFAATDL